MTEVNIDLDFATACRICLQGEEENGQMISIYDNDLENPTLQIYEKIETCGDIKLIIDPELPSHICKKCYAFLSIAHKFRIICKNSDIYLREFVSKPHTLPKSTDEPDYDVEYLLEYNPETGDSTSVSHVVQQEIPEVEENQMLDYEVLDNYAELWVDEGTEEVNGENYIDFDLEDPNNTNLIDTNEVVEDVKPAIRRYKRKGRDAKGPAKTLEISSDGAAIIRVKTESKEQQKHICDICGNIYPRKYALEGHMRRHRNERPFECEICHQSFHLNFQLTRHIRKHTGVRPYVCQYCKRSFVDRSTLNKHERLHRNERPFKCDTCGKSFTYSSVLKVHKMTHTGEKPFNCGICGKRFSRSHHLRAHLETIQHQHDPRAKILLKQIKREEETNNEIENEEFMILSAQ